MSVAPPDYSIPFFGEALMRYSELEWRGIGVLGNTALLLLTSHIYPVGRACGVDEVLPMISSRSRSKYYYYYLSF